MGGLSGGGVVEAMWTRRWSRPTGEKEAAAPTFKRGFGFHPLGAFVDHGAAGTGEPLAGLLRKGNAGSNTAPDHITVIRQALAQLPGPGARSWSGSMAPAAPTS